MIQMKRISEEVYFADQAIVHLGPDDVSFLRNNVETTVRQRTRLCAHKGPEDGLHEMFVVYTNNTYMRPNKHPKDESLHILGGCADFVFFDLKGNVTNIVQLGDAASDRPFYCRVPKETYHTVLIRSERLTIHEGLSGPFRRDSTTVFAPWAPKETDLEGVRFFSARLEADVARRLAATSPTTLRMVQQSPEVFLSDEPVGKFGHRELDILRKALPKSSRKRVRVCMHNSVEDRFQEMFITFAKGSYLTASKHLGKDESVDVVEGKADFVLFNDAGEITNVISVGDPSTGLPFYMRTPHERWHAWIVRSDVFTVHETTEGPFRREDTILAPWSPANVDDLVAVPRYQKKLEAEVAGFLAQSGAPTSSA
jgi:cupin fold WbuC family metalloprotein